MFRLLSKNKKSVFLIADVISISAAIYLAFLLRFEWQIPDPYLQNAFWMIILAIVFTLPSFLFFRLYSFSWSYVSTQELISLTKALISAWIFLEASLFVLQTQPIFSGFPRSTLFISFILAFIFSGGTRFAKRIYLQLFRDKKEDKERILIVGAGATGEQTLRNILSSMSDYQPVGFIDDDQTKQGILIHGIKVLGRVEDIPRIVAQNSIESMIIAFPAAGSRVIRRAVELGRIAKLKKIKIIPSIGDIINGQASIGELREVEVEDLLGREPVSLDKTAISGFLGNKKILITGSAGSIGSELCRQIVKFNPSSILLLDQDETGIFNILNDLKGRFPKPKVFSSVGDVLDEERIDRIFKNFRPQIVFHAAAYKHVPLMEENPDEAVKNNIFGTEVLARASLKYEVEKFIFVSTDKAVKPSSVMGVTKRVGEMICQSLNLDASAKFISVRFGNVLNSRGSVIPVFREQIKKGGPVEITHPDMQRYFMTTSEACLLVMQAGAMGQGGEVFVLDMGEPIKILDLAKEMIRLSGLEPDKDVPIVFIGIRPGEKLSEETLTAEEGIIATQNQKIFIAKLSDIDPCKLNSGLEKLKKAATIGSREGIVGTLAELVPSYYGKKI
ncbi:MAG: nucleoside-diphosphate sugar epimerase/dehydratase [Candidatus Wildermuthbacteria bacterium]|nr:nucleoside-diphosphate sugar epimerase/dehydratase [Candidatus Wildermuthbacteria bacterium]